MSVPRIRLLDPPRPPVMPAEQQDAVEELASLPGEPSLLDLTRLVLDCHRYYEQLLVIINKQHEQLHDALTRLAALEDAAASDPSAD